MFDEKLDAFDRSIATDIWLSISKSVKIRAKLQTEKLPIKIYHYMREEDPVKSHKIIKRDDVDFKALA